MAFLSQHNFPALWEFFQIFLGGTYDKRKLVLLKYKHQKRILEVGCSLGNIATAFLPYKNITYTGIDIDEVVITYARKKFHFHKNFKFLCDDLLDFSKSRETYDYILFAGVCHHINDQDCVKMLQAAQKLLDPNGDLWVIDILYPEKNDPKLMHWYIHLDQGEFIRNDAQLRALIGKAAHIKEAEIHNVGATPFSWPHCMRFGVYHLVALQRHPY